MILVFTSKAFHFFPSNSSKTRVVYVIRLSVRRDIWKIWHRYVSNTNKGAN